MPAMYRFLACVMLAAVFVCAADAPAPAYPLWDGHETIEQYAKRANLPPTKALDLGNGVTMDFVLIPAGSFIMGTPEPVPVDEAAFKQKILVGQAAFAVGVGILLVLIATVIIRAIREHHRPQYSLARFMAMTLAASVAVLGGMHWWHSVKTLAEAQAEYAAALARYSRAADNEKPAHEVTLTKPFFIGKYEVTQQQYQQVIGVNPSNFKGANLPVETVSWNDAQEFCKAVTHFAELRSADPQSGNMRHDIRLPTEAEWEFACRAGTRTAYYTGDDETTLENAAWCIENSNRATHPVGCREPNAWGVYDMHGNLWEWCSGHKDDNLTALINPKGETEEKWRVLRGGSWFLHPYYCRSAYRCRPTTPVHPSDCSGFRCAIDP
jgi:formylglycine-generating enzyme required for sulfatase activity